MAKQQSVAPSFSGTAGDFTGLADDYAQYRPDYSPSVLKALLGLLGKPAAEVDFVDVGAGTGIWSRMVAAMGVNSAIAVEPNDAMRVKGIAGNAGMKIEWLSGRAEQTGLQALSADWLTMASSFHWADYDAAIQEFARVLRPGGYFTALWNPRLVEVNPLLAEIEDHIKTLAPNLKRTSSGRSGITESLTTRLHATSCFDDVVYVEGRHVIGMSPERYLGAWRSVNDLRVQLGPDKFEAFLGFVEHRIAGLDSIEATYLTRAWSARVRT